MTTTRISSFPGGNGNGESFLQGGFQFQDIQNPDLNPNPTGTIIVFDTFLPFWWRGRWELSDTSGNPGEDWPINTPGGIGPGSVLADCPKTESGCDNAVIVFSSAAFNFPGVNDSNGVMDVYVKQREEGTFMSPSLKRWNGQQSSQPSWNAVISADGEYIAYQSQDFNQVSGQGEANDLDGHDSDIILYNVQTGAKILVSRIANGGTSPFQADNILPSINSNGRYVAFESTADAINGEFTQRFSQQNETDTNDDDIFVFDRVTQTVTQASIKDGLAWSAVDNANPRGGTGDVNGNAYNPSIDGSGRLVVFDFAQINFEKGGLVGEIEVADQREIYLRNLATNDTVLISRRANGQISESGGGSFNPYISPNGRYVAFASTHTDMVSGTDNNGPAPDIFLFDRNSGDLTRVSVSTDGVQGNNASWNPQVDDEGRVVFTSLAGNLVSGDNNALADVFMHDSNKGTTIRISVTDATPPGQANDTSDNGSLGVDGAVAFDSDATNLIVGDPVSDINVYVNDDLGGGGGGGTPPAQRVTSDFNGDGFNDIVYQQTSWNGANPQQARVVYYDPVNDDATGRGWYNFVSNAVTNIPSFKVSAIGNFDQTDTSPEILIYSPTTGQNFLFNPLDSIQFTTLRDPNNPAALLNTANIKPVTAGDTNGDGIDEIVYRKDAVPTGETDPTPEIAAGSNYFYDPVTGQFELINVTTNDAPYAAGELDSDNHLEIVYGNPVSGEYRVYDVVTEQFSELFADPQQTAPGFLATGTYNADATKPDLVIFQSQNNAETVGYNLSAGKFDAAIATTPGWFSLS